MNVVGFIAEVVGVRVAALARHTAIATTMQLL